MGDEVFDDPLNGPTMDYRDLLKIVEVAPEESNPEASTTASSTEPESK
jgi:hypothetical protein